MREHTRGAQVKPGLNAKLRGWNMVLLGVTVVLSLVGWLMDKDPSKLMVVFGALTSSQVGLEAAMVGKRATFKKEAQEGIPT